MTWPLARHVSTVLPGPSDPQLQAWVLAWDAYALRSDPLGVWQSPLFYPYPDTLAYQDHMLVLVLPVAPLLWLGATPVLALNLLLLASYALGGLAVYQLALELFAPAEASITVPHQAAAFVAGVAFTFCAYRMIHIVHVNLLQIFWLVWALLFLIRTLRYSRWRDALLFGLFAGLQVANSVYYTFFALAALGWYVALWAAWVLWRRVRTGVALPWHSLAQLAVGGVVAALIGIPFLLPYLRLYQSLAIVRSPREIDNWSAPLQAYLAVPEFNRLYGERAAFFQASGGEFALFP
ncbi:MAG TPA: hypothetical protein VFT99_20530, partial [Roseiflexaceae bacterium]|nr:hypothetical protein [Roseiflexaceae bacterium]